MRELNSSCPAVSQIIMCTVSASSSTSNCFSMKSTPIVFLYVSVKMPWQKSFASVDLPTIPLPRTTHLIVVEKSSQVMSSIMCVFVATPCERACWREGNGRDGVLAVRAVCVGGDVSAGSIVGGQRARG